MTNTNAFLGWCELSLEVAGITGALIAVARELEPGSFAHTVLTEQITRLQCAREAARHKVFAAAEAAA